MKKNMLIAGACAGIMAVGCFSFAPSVTYADDGDSLIMNGDFEEGRTVGWDIAGDRGAVSVSTKQGDVKGKAALHYWDNKAFKFTAQQTVEDVPDGTYDFTVDTMGGGGENGITFFVDVNGQKKTVPVKDTKWNEWHTWTIQGVEVKGGKCTIGVAVDANSGNWGSIDNFTMMKK